MVNIVQYVEFCSGTLQPTCSSSLDGLLIILKPLLVSKRFLIWYAYCVNIQVIKCEYPMRQMKYYYLK